MDAGWAAPEPMAEEVATVGEGGRGANAREAQRTLFSWAEFMAEDPVNPKRRSRMPEPASISLLEWALEREAEPAGADR